MGHTWESGEATIGGSESHRGDETGGSDQADWSTYPMPSYVLHAGYLVTSFAVNLPYYVRYYKQTSIQVVNFDHASTILGTIRKHAHI